MRWTHSHGDFTDRTITADMSALRRRLVANSNRVARPAHLSRKATASFRRAPMVLHVPSLNRRAMVLWLPPGAYSFACRQSWGRQVAYASQFMARADRAHHHTGRSTLDCAALAVLTRTSGISLPNPTGCAGTRTRRPMRSLSRTTVSGRPLPNGRRESHVQARLSAVAAKILTQNPAMISVSETQ
jgi:hypothetical protein